MTKKPIIAILGNSFAAILFLKNIKDTENLEIIHIGAASKSPLFVTLCKGTTPLLHELSLSGKTFTSFFCNSNQQENTMVESEWQSIRTSEITLETIPGLIQIEGSLESFRVSDVSGLVTLFLDQNRSLVVDMLVAADGLHSVARELLLNHRAMPIPSGIVYIEGVLNYSDCSLNLNEYPTAGLQLGNNAVIGIVDLNAGLGWTLMSRSTVPVENQNAKEYAQQCALLSGFSEIFTNMIMSSI